MKFNEAIKLALQSLWANKLRTVLTLIGVVMAVASVIMVITLVSGANWYVSNKLSGYGADVVSVQKEGLVFGPDSYFKYQKRKILRMDDYEAVSAGCANCKEVGAAVNRTTTVVANGHSSNNSSLRGYTPAMFSLRNIDIAEGRALTLADVDHATHDAVIGPDIVDNLLGTGNPLGTEIRVNGIPYTVVGIGDRQGKTLGQSQDNWVVIPITTYQQIYGYNDSVGIFARANGDAAVMERAKDEIRVLMRTRRHNAPGSEDDFELQTNDTFLDIWKQISSIFATVVLGLASIALVVGGVVIMNIMLVSVTERTREIGVRKALGAKQRDILIQFLIESCTMALLGGAIGVGFGVGAGQIITLAVGWPSMVPVWAIFLGLALAGSVGIFFGVYPASKAAQLDPIVALRAEM